MYITRTALSIISGTSNSSRHNSVEPFFVSFLAGLVGTSSHRHRSTAVDGISYSSNLLSHPQFLEFTYIQMFILFYILNPPHSIIPNNHSLPSSSSPSCFRVQATYLTCFECSFCLLVIHVDHTVNHRTIEHLFHKNTLCTPFISKYLTSMLPPFPTRNS